MKKITLFVGIVLTILSLSAKTSYSQAVLDLGGTNQLILGGEFVPSIDYLLVITPSGNYIHNVTWQLSPGNPYIPSQGVIKVWLVTFLANQLWFAEAKIHSNGKVHVVFHINGSGHFTPNNPG